MNRKELLAKIDEKFQEVFEMIADYIEDQSQNTMQISEEDDNAPSDESSSIEVESDDDGDYLDKDGNIYNIETSEIIGQMFKLKLKNIKAFKDDDGDFIDKDGVIYDVESSPIKIIGKQTKSGKKTFKKPKTRNL